jgi:hypothetical protein
VRDLSLKLALLPENRVWAEPDLSERLLHHGVVHEDENARKDSSRPLGMTIPVISNEVRDLSLVLFSEEVTKVGQRAGKK